MFSIVSGILEKNEAFKWNEQKLEMLKREQINSATMVILNSGLLEK